MIKSIRINSKKKRYRNKLLRREKRANSRTNIINDHNIIINNRDWFIIYYVTLVDL